MVACGDHHRTQNGKGVIDSIMSKFTAQRYPNERHAYSWAPKTYGVAMNFMGPHTRLDLRLKPNGEPKDDSQPVNNADYESYLHDLAYDKAKKEYEKSPTPQNKKQQLQKIWQADNRFINAMDRDREEPMAPVAGALIQTKESLEKAGLMDTKRFSGFGMDPTARLKELVKQKYTIQDIEEKKNKKRLQKGGVLPLVAIGTAAAGAVAGMIVGDIYEYIKKKISGHGYEIPNHRTRKEKREFMINLLKTL